MALSDDLTAAMMQEGIGQTRRTRLLSRFREAAIKNRAKRLASPYMCAVAFKACGRKRAYLVNKAPPETLEREYFSESRVSLRHPAPEFLSQRARRDLGKPASLLA